MESENQKQQDEANEQIRQRNRLLTTWMRLFSETCRMRENEELTPEKIKAYALTLSDLPLDALERGLKKASEECTWFPTPAEIRKFGFAAITTQDNFEADKAWENVQQMLRRHWFGEIYPVMSATKPENWTGRIEDHGNGLYSIWPQPFDAATDYAIRLAGGLTRIVNASGDREMDFVRRDFLTNHKRHRETLGLIAPSREEARALLESLKPKQVTGETQ